MTNDENVAPKVAADKLISTESLLRRAESMPTESPINGAPQRAVDPTENA